MEAIKREGKLCENENTDVIFCGKDLKLQLSCVMAGRGIGAGDINMARARAGVTADTGHTTAIDEPREGHLITFDINISNTDII